MEKATMRRRAVTSGRSSIFRRRWSSRLPPHHTGKWPGRFGKGNGETDQIHQIHIQAAWRVKYPVIQKGQLMFHKISLLLTLLLALCAISSFAIGSAHATSSPPDLTVNSTADTNDSSCDALGTGTGNHDCTLREAINAVNAKNGF